MVFFDKDLLDTEYLRRLRKVENSYRNDKILINSLESIYQYNKPHAMSFTKRIKAQHKNFNFNGCESIFSEIIVYEFYLKLYYEGIIKSLHIKKDDYDLRIELSDGSFHYLEIFCVMPDLKISKEGEVIVNDIKTHLQEPSSSIRQKLLRKINKQKQLSKPRYNFAVIELNDVSIADDFSILSSLSDGYKIKISKETGEILSKGFDWSRSIFDNNTVGYIKAIIYFSLGKYNNRKYIINPNFKL